MSFIRSCFDCQNCTDTCGKSITQVVLDPLSIKSYTIQSDNVIKRGTCEHRVQFKHNDYDMTDIQKKYHWIKIECFKLEKINAESSVIVLHIKNQTIEAKQKKFTILYSQNELYDLGTSITFLIDLSTQLKCDIITFDYSGYGQSQGNASIDNIFEDIKRVVDFSIKSLGCPLNELIIFGNSIGTIGVLYLSLLKEYANIKGMILLSPSFTGKETNKISLSSYSEIACPVLIIHGLKDDIISHSVSVDMVKKIKFTCQWFPSKAGHYNVISLYRSKFYQRILLFFQYVFHYDTCSSNSFDYPFSMNSYYKNNKVQRIKIMDGYIKCSNNKTPMLSQDKSYGIYIQDDTSAKSKGLMNFFLSSNQPNINLKPPTESEGTFGLFP